MSHDEIIPARPTGPRERDRRIAVTARANLRALDEALETVPAAIDAHAKQLRTLIRLHGKRRDLADCPGPEGLRGVAQGAVALVSLLVELSTRTQGLAGELIDRADHADSTPEQQLPPPEPPVSDPPS